MYRGKDIIIEYGFARKKGFFHGYISTCYFISLEEYDRTVALTVYLRIV